MAFSISDRIGARAQPVRKKEEPTSTAQITSPASLAVQSSEHCASGPLHPHSGAKSHQGDLLSGKETAREGDSGLRGAGSPPAQAALLTCAGRIPLPASNVPRARLLRCLLEKPKGQLSSKVLSSPFQFIPLALVTGTLCQPGKSGIVETTRKGLVQRLLKALGRCGCVCAAASTDQEGQVRRERELGGKSRAGPDPLSALPSRISEAIGRRDSGAGCGSAERLGGLRGFWGCVSHCSSLNLQPTRQDAEGCLGEAMEPLGISCNV